MQSECDTDLNRYTGREMDVEELIRLGFITEELDLVLIPVRE
jgi:hypothetical protein